MLSLFMLLYASGKSLFLYNYSFLFFVFSFLLEIVPLAYWATLAYSEYPQV